MFPKEYVDNFDANDHPSVDDMRIIWHSVAAHIRCYSDDTEILTENGWKLFKDVSKDEMVLTLNPDTFELEYQFPTEIHEYNYTGDMVNVLGRYCDLLVNPDHSMFLAKRQRDNSWKWRFEKVKDNLSKIYKIPKSGKWEGVPVDFVKIGDKRIPIRDYLRFMAHYLSEGYFEHTVYNSNYTVALCQNSSRLDIFTESLSLVTDNKVSLVDGRKAIVRDKSLWEYVKPFGYSYEKYLPNLIKMLPPDDLRYFIECYEQGDGNKSKDPRGLFTSSIKLRDDLQEIIIKAGYGSDYSVSKGIGCEGNFGKSNYILWRISINERGRIHQLHSKLKDKIVDYSGKIYSLTVPNHTLLVRRNGKAVVSGNSGYGTVTRHVCTRLINLGYNVVVNAYYGLEPGGVVLINDVPHIPVKKHLGRFGEGSYLHHYKSFNRNCGILCSDFWAFPWFPGGGRYSVCYCNDDQTEILTNNGWKLFKDLTDEDLVASLENDKNLVFVKPKRIVSFDHKGPMYRLKSKFIDMKVTPEHRIYVKRKMQKNFELVKAKDTFGMYKTFKKNADWIGTSPSHIEIPEYSNTWDNKNNGIISYSKEKLRIPIEYWIDFIGFYLSEGCTSDYAIQLSQDPDSEFFDDMYRSIENIGFEPKVYDGSLIRFHSVQFVKYLKDNYGSNAYEKRIPPFIKSLNPNLLRRLLTALRKGDGDRNRPRYATKSKILADDIQEIAIKCGYACDVRYDKTNESYRLTFSSKFTEVRDRHRSNGLGNNSVEEWQEYDGKVYSVVVPSGIILVRRNGVAHWTGNSPMDHINYTQNYLDLARQYNRVISFLPFQQEMLRAEGIETPVIPHGVDRIFRPIPQKEARSMAQMPDDCFLVGIVSANCLDEETEILTKSGWKRYEDYTMDDLTATVSIDGSIEYQYPSDINSQFYTGKMYKLKTKYIDILVTPEHGLQVKRKIIYRKDRPKELSRIKEIGKTYEYTNFYKETPTEMFGKPRKFRKGNLKWEGEDKEYFVIPEYTNDWYAGNGYRQHRKIDRTAIKVKMDDFLPLLAYYISEGSCSDHVVTIHQLDDDKRQKMFNIISKLPFDPKLYDDRICICDVQLASYFKKLGTKSWKKSIPEEFKELSKRQLEILWEHLVLGDGWDTQSSESYGTTSLKLAGDIQEILLKLGDTGDLCIKEPVGNDSLGYKINKEDCHTFYTIHRNRTVLEPQNRPTSNERPVNFVEEWKDYSGIVWCPTIPNHTIIIRRNGKILVSYQSDKEMRKSWGEIFMAAEYIKKEYPSVYRSMKFFAHTDPEDPKGVSLQALAHKHGVLNAFAFEDTHIHTVGIPDSEMNLLYNSFDLLLTPSKREGFGLPILEGMATGLPCLGHNFSSMPDLIGHNEERGWLAKTKMYQDTPIIATTGVPDYVDIAEKLVYAYNHPDELEEKGKKAREFSQNYLWDDVVMEGWVPLLDSITEERTSVPLDDIAKVRL